MADSAILLFELNDYLRKVTHDGYGYFITKINKRTQSTGNEILAKLTSEDAASGLVQLHGMTLMAACE